MNSQELKDLLIGIVDSISDSPESFFRNPHKDFTRKRKLPVSQLMLSIIGMEGNTIAKELLKTFDFSTTTPSVSAFIQQRNKLKPDAFKTVFHEFSSQLFPEDPKHLRLLAVDGSDVEIAHNPNDSSTYIPPRKNNNGINMLHVNALYDLEKHIYVDSIVQGKRIFNEHNALVSMVDQSSISHALIIADRGYEAYNNLAHIQEKGWYFLIRIKDGRFGIKESYDVPKTDEFDIQLHLRLTRKNTYDVRKLCKENNEYKRLSHTTPFDYLPPTCRKKDSFQFYELHCRMVRIALAEGVFETLITNLDTDTYPPDAIKKLYALRWGIETSFRDLKYTIGLLRFHSKKKTCILQEIYAQLIMYNFSEMIVSQVSVQHKPRNHIYKINFSMAVFMCRRFYDGKITSSDMEAVIAKNLIPIRPDRQYIRKCRSQPHHFFIYRIA